MHTREMMSENETPAATGRADAARSRTGLILIGGVIALVLIVVALYLRASAKTNHVALSALPKPVSVVKVEAASFRPSRSYVGTMMPWGAARVGPQYVAAYLGAVLVRPGAVVRRGDVIATLDCRSSSLEAKAIAARARALSQRQNAVEHEAERVNGLAAGGFTSQNELEQIKARSASEQAEVEGLRASLQSRNLQVDDCVLRAPFTGEVAERFLDPGAYVRPGNAVAAIIDRSIVRLTADAPESDFVAVAPGTAVGITVLATGVHLRGKISRRAPAADESTRTVHFEIDLPNADRSLPVGTTATVDIEVGKPQPASSLPLRAATLRGDKASVFVVEGGIARRAIVKSLGEAGGTLYLDRSLAPGSLVVVEGRALLDDNDRVAAKEMTPETTTQTTTPTTTPGTKK